MPKLRCRCGSVHNMSPIPDDSWRTIRDRDLSDVWPREGAVVPTGSDVAERLTELSGFMYECPECRRLMWSLPGDRCTNFRVYERVQ